MRLFVALELPGEAVEALGRFAAAAAAPDVWRTVPPESLHVTLAFLGATDEALVPAIAAALSAGGDAAPRLALAGALLLPPRRARVLCAALADPDGRLGELQAAVAGALVAAGVYEPERRPFRPHVTVARLRPRARAPRVVDVDPAGLSFHGAAVTLFSSRTSPAGARYEALGRQLLASSPGERQLPH
jgi:RNA 2',3'-cyclic 3'-phosphodiesterase